MWLFCLIPSWVCLARLVSSDFFPERSHRWCSSGRFRKIVCNASAQNEFLNIVLGESSQTEFSNGVLEESSPRVFLRHATFRADTKFSEIQCVYNN